jgi:hypothetical protein
LILAQRVISYGMTRNPCEGIECNVMVQKKSPSWKDAKARLAEFNRTNLLALVKDDLAQAITEMFCSRVFTLFAKSFMLTTS